MVVDKSFSIQILLIPETIYQLANFTTDVQNIVVKTN